MITTNIVYPSEKYFKSFHEALPIVAKDGPVDWAWDFSLSLEVKVWD
jgi:hypothetical protein